MLLLGSIRSIMIICIKIDNFNFMDILVTENYGQLDHEIRLSEKSNGNKFISTDAVDDYKKSIAAAGYLHIFIHTA